MSKESKVAIGGLLGFIVFLAIGIFMAVLGAPTLALILINIAMLSLILAVIFGLVALVKRLRRERRDTSYTQDGPGGPGQA